MLIQQLNGVYSTLDPGIFSPAKLIRYTSLLGLHPFHLQYALRRQLSLLLSIYDRSDAWVPIKTNEPPYHHVPIHCPWWLVVCHPLRKVLNNHYKVCTGLPGLQELVMEAR